MNERDSKYRIVEQLLEIFEPDKGPVIGIQKRLVREGGYDARDRWIKIQPENDDKCRSQQHIAKRRLTETLPCRPKAPLCVLRRAAKILFLTSHDGRAVAEVLPDSLRVLELVVLCPLLERVVEFLSGIFRSALLVDYFLQRFSEVIDDESPVDGG